MVIASQRQLQPWLIVSSNGWLSVSNGLGDLVESHRMEMICLVIAFLLASQHDGLYSECLTLHDTARMRTIHSTMCRGKYVTLVTTV